MLTAKLADAEAAEQAARKLASSQSGASVTTERALDAAREQLSRLPRVLGRAAEPSVYPRGCTLTPSSSTRRRAIGCRPPSARPGSSSRPPSASWRTHAAEHTRLQASCEATSRALEQRADALAAAGDGLARRRALVRADGSRYCPRGSSSTKLKTMLAWTAPRSG